MKSRIRISSEETGNNSPSTGSIVGAAKKFEEHGAIWIENVFDREFIRQLAVAYDETYVVQGKGNLKKKHAHVGHSRFMVTVDVVPPFDSPQLYANPILMPVLHRLLGPHCRISSFGSVVTFAGAGDQPIHLDHPPLFESEATCNALPPYAITVVIPLIDIETETGSTAIWEGTHKSPGSHTHLQNLMETPTWEGSVHPLPGMGDAYLMDYRVIHGGMANNSDQNRPILYMVYCRPWFHDAFNFNDQKAIDISPDALARVPAEHRGLFASVR